MEELRTFGNDETPIVNIDSKPKNVLVFNQEYVDKYLFQEDIINNTFEILINTHEYNVAQNRINDLFNELTVAIASSSLKEVKEKLESFIKTIDFKSSKKKGLEVKTTCKFAKGRKLPIIDEVLSEETKKYHFELNDDKNHEWLKWFNTGIEMIKNKELNKCPLCKNELPKNLVNIANEINQLVDTTTLKTNMEVKQSIGNIKKFLDTSRTKMLESIVNSDKELTQEQTSTLKEIVEIMKSEASKLNNLSSLNVINIKKMYEDNTLDLFLKENKLDLNVFNSLPKNNFEEIKLVNESIDKIILKNLELVQLTKEFSIYLNGLVREKTNYINDFFIIAGIPYRVSIESISNNKYKTVLKPINSDIIVKKESLSYGEKNAISLMLFTLEAEKYDLIILDDPVSSFDNNKKFALLYYLFSKKEALLENKTVILFTHDFDIIIDFFYKGELKNLNKNCYLISSKNGELIEKEISNREVKNTVKQWLKKAKSSQINPLLRIVNLRKYFDYVDTERTIEKEIISSLEHRYDVPMKKKKKVLTVINSEDLIEPIKYIKENYINDFDYDKYLHLINNNDNLKKWYNSTSSDIDKLQIMRVYLDINKDIPMENHAFLAFVKEAYHVENNELQSLNEKIYNVIPYYIIKICDEIMSKY